MRILFVGDLWDGSTSLQRMNALHDLESRVDGVDSTVSLAALPSSKRLVYRICGKLFRPGLGFVQRREAAGVSASIRRRIQR